MDMRMMFQLLIPGMENAEESDVGSEMFGIPSDFDQGFRAGAEQQIVNELLILQCERRQETRKREDDVNVARWQQFLTARFDPTVPSVGLAFWAVPVSAGVVGDGAIPAAGTFIQMTAECSRAAALDGCQNFEMLASEPLAAAFDELLSRGADEIGHLQGWPTHLRIPVRLAHLLCD